MREMLFRGKDIKTGKWVYGYYASDVRVVQQRHYILTGNWEYEVYWETVGQYTGKKDKNDKEIYEGDIVKLGDSPIHDGILVKCVFADWRMGFVYEFLTGNNKGKFTDMTDTWRSYEVIGTIHDEPKPMDVQL